MFSHTLYVSDACALSGEGITGYHNQSKYYLTSKKTELDFFKTRASLLIKKAASLMNIYTKENKKDFEKFFKNEKADKNNIILELDNNDLKNTFKNISFTICKDKWILIQKKTSPEINFVIYHKTLRDAIENFITLVKE